MDNRLEKICAVVVTYNRIILLQECLDALLSQSYLPDSIIIVDNGSTDGTEEMLNKKYFHNPIFEYINTWINIWWAGWFYEWMKLAYEKKFSWIWVMDDDGKPDSLCLEKLIFFAQKWDKYSTYLPLVTTPKGELTWDFSILKESKTFDIHKIESVSELEDDIYPTFWVWLLWWLYSYEILHDYWYPDKRLFIRWDENEFNKRLLVNNIKSFFIKDAIFFHPKEVIKYLNIFWKKIKYNGADFPLFKLYFQLRNRILISKKYSKYAYLIILRIIIIQILLSIIQINLHKSYLKKLRVVYLAIFHWITERFDNQEMMVFLTKK